MLEARPLAKPRLTVAEVLAVFRAVAGRRVSVLVRLIPIPISCHPSLSGVGFDFLEVADVGEVLEIFVLGPEGGVVGEGGGVDETVCHGEFVVK